MRPDIKDFTLPELEENIISMGEPRYRAEQVFLWLYRKRTSDFGLMLNIPGALRKKLSENFPPRNLEACERRKAADGVEKFLFRLHDGEFTESVIIPSPGRNTICVSTQVGCSRKCKFCASGAMGFKRNLEPGEITGQFLEAENITGDKITNIVFMGMGEPFDNYRNLCRAIRILNHPAGINISARRMTVSTAGIIEGIEKFTSFEMPVKLAVSLHAPDQELRSSIMPVSRKNPLPRLLKALAAFRKTGRKLTLEYALIKDVNDSPRAAGKLARIAGRLDCAVNIISFNPVPGSPFEAPPDKTVEDFMNELHSLGVMVSLRRARGPEISAACGQLAGKRR